MYVCINPSIYHIYPIFYGIIVVIYSYVYLFYRFKLSDRENEWRFRNFFRTTADQIYDEQTPGTQQRIDKLSARVRRFTTRFNTVKRERAPLGKEVIKRHLIGGATSFADILDGKHAVKRAPIKPPVQSKKRMRKHKVVK